MFLLTYFIILELFDKNYTMNKRYLNQDDINSNLIQASIEKEFPNSFSCEFIKKESTDEKIFINNLYFHDSKFDKTSRNTTSDIKDKTNNTNIDNKLEIDKFNSLKKEVKKSYEKKDKDIPNIINDSDDFLSKENNTIEKIDSLKDITHLEQDKQILENKNNFSLSPTYTNKIWIRGPYKKKNKIIQKTQTDDKCFPFSSGKGLIKTIGNKYIEKDKEGSSVQNLFKTKQFVIDSNGKITKLKKTRKFKSDDIRKKIKAKFHKALKDIINHNLKKAGSKESLSYISNYFMGNVSKKFNKKYMNITYEELLSIDFTKCEGNCINSKVIQKQFINNQNLLIYLQNNPNISKLSGFDLIKNMKYKDIIQLYFLSEEFENTIQQLKNKKESDTYINAYINISQNYINYFCDEK